MLFTLWASSLTLFSLFLSQGVSGALSVLMKDAIKPTLMQTLEVRRFLLCG